MTTKIYYLKLINEKQSEIDFGQKILSTYHNCDRPIGVRVFTD